VTIKTLQCRDHGGTFEVEAKRGRPPVRCTADGPCTRAGKSDRVVAKEIVEKVVARTKPPRSTIPTESALRTSKWCVCDGHGTERHQRGIEGCKYATKGSAVVVRHNASIPLAAHAREQLEPIGWALKGRGWFEGEDAYAEVIGARGAESIVITWKNGKAIRQEYMIWDPEKTSGQNGAPRNSLTFNPHEMTDSELIKAIAGRKITWFNRLGKSAETAILGDKIQIEHTYNGTGDESLRIVKFVDKAGTGFRAFHVEALLKVNN
jgi:hypothetical protein